MKAGEEPECKGGLEHKAVATVGYEVQYLLEDIECDRFHSIWRGRQYVGAFKGHEYFRGEADVRNAVSNMYVPYCC